MRRTLPASSTARTPWPRVALFFLILAVPLAAGEAYLRSLPNPYKAKHAYLTAHSREVETLILGSSHAYYGIHPETLGPHAYSAAMVSQTLRYDYYLLRHYPFPRLRTVVLTVSDFTLYEEIEDGREWYLANQYRLYMDCDIHPRLSVYGWEVTAFRIYCEKLRSLWQPPRMGWSATGQGTEYTLRNKAADWDNAAARVKTNRYDDFSRAPRQTAVLQSIADWCRDHGATLLLVSTPLSPAYRALQNPAQVSDTESRLKTFLDSTPHARRLDFRADPRFGPDDFYDADHLTFNGSRKLSRLIIEAAGAR